ncbi:MAG: glycosyltransferase [Chitinophagales bacterium]
MEIFFSIIIPTYNRADLIAETLRSVITQTYTRFEVIVVDDGSTDNTQEVVEKVGSPLVTYYRIPNSERGAARNFGVSKARGNYVTFLDSDDVFYNNCLAFAEEGLKRNNYPPFFHQAYEIGDAQHITVKVDNLRNDDLDMFLTGNHLSCIGVFIARDVFAKHKFCEDRNLSGSEDYELWMRLAANYGLKTDNRISARLNLHDMRSVLQINVQNLIKRKNLFLFYVFQDQAVQQIFGNRKNIVESYCDSYISLHLVLAGDVNLSWHYLTTAFLAYPQCLFDRRTFAILKYTILSFFKRKAT